MILELAIGVPTWNVARFVLFSLVITTVLSRLWSLSVAIRAGVRVNSGRAVELIPRTYTRGSLVSEEDRRDTVFKWLLIIVTVLLSCSDLLMEFGSSTSEVSTGRIVVTGYELAKEHVPLEVVGVGRGKWAPTVVTPVGHSTVYQVQAFEPEPEGDSALTPADLEILKNSRRTVQSGGQMVTAETPDEWLLVGRNETLWFSGTAGTAILKDDGVFLHDGFSTYLLKEINRGPNHSVAILEVIGNRVLLQNMPIYSQDGIEVVVEMLELPRLSLDCNSPAKYPDEWEVRCVDTLREPATVYRHDRNRAEIGATALTTHDLDVDYGRRVQVGGIPGKLLAARSMFASSLTQRITGEIAWGNDFTVTATRTSLVLVSRNGSDVAMCLAPIRDLQTSNRFSCRRRQWNSIEEMVSAFQALQLSTVDFESFWSIRTRWEEASDVRALTRVAWISKSLRERSGTVRFETKTVATIDSLFVGGLSIIAAVMATGVAIYVFYLKASRCGTESCRFLTLDGSRRILAMSAIDKYNCGKVPTLPPKTALLRSGEWTCHLSTYYASDEKPISLEEVKESKLLILGVRNRRNRRIDGSELKWGDDSSRRAPEMPV